MRGHVTNQEDRMDGRQKGRTPTFVHQNLTNWEAPFAMLSANLKVTSYFVRFLYKIVCIVCVHRAQLCVSRRILNCWICCKQCLHEIRNLVLRDFVFPNVNLENGSAPRGTPKTAALTWCDPTRQNTMIIVGQRSMLLDLVITRQQEDITKLAIEPLGKDDHVVTGLAYCAE